MRIPHVHEMKPPPPPLHPPAPSKPLFPRLTRSRVTGYGLRVTGRPSGPNNPLIARRYLVGVLIIRSMTVGGMLMDVVEYFHV